MAPLISVFDIVTTLSACGDAECSRGDEHSGFVHARLFTVVRGRLAQGNVSAMENLLEPESRWSMIQARDRT